MYVNFNKLDEVKQKRILDAAMLEFSRYGYSKTSVEQIAKAAGISKSMIFHYFGNKQKLYNYLVIYSSEYILEKYKDYIDSLKNYDYIERYKLSAISKLDSLNNEGPLFRFSGSLYIENDKKMLSEESMDKLDKVLSLSKNYAQTLHEDFEGTKLRNDIPKEVSLKYIQWIMDGFSQELISKLKMKSLADADFSEDWKNFDEILVNLEKIFYKKTGENDD